MDAAALLGNAPGVEYESVDGFVAAKVRPSTPIVDDGIPQVSERSNAAAVSNGNNREACGDSTVAVEPVGEHVMSGK